MSDTIDEKEEPVGLPAPGELLCGLKRGFIYSLCRRNLIRSVVVKQPGKERGGVMLLYKSSLLDFIRRAPSVADSVERARQRKVGP